MIARSRPEAAANHRSIGVEAKGRTRGYTHDWTPLGRKAIYEAMVRLADGDRGGFDVLLNELWPVILSFAECSVGSNTDAKDVAEEVS